MLIQRVSQQILLLSTYPALNCSNEDPQKIFNQFPEKIPIFGYGALINPKAIAKTLGSEAVHLKPAAAFGLKRIFNKTGGSAARPELNLKVNERAFLNVEPTTTYHSVINGVLIEVSRVELIKLIQREKGYDLTPILVVDWNDITSCNPDPRIQVAYTFYVPHGLRNGINYTHTKYYPIRFYLHSVQEGAAAFGQAFLDFWNDTTYMADGTTLIKDWDQQTFSGLLDTREP